MSDFYEPVKGFTIDVVSMTTAVYTGKARFVVVPGENGELGILPGHAPLMSELRAGWIRIQSLEDGAEQRFYASGGLVEVQPTRVTVLLDFLVDARQAADQEGERQAFEHANLLRARVTAREYAKLEAELYKALNNLQGTQALRVRKPIR